MATVLALEKDALHLELLTFLLNQDGHTVHGTTDADIAFDILQLESIDLVVVETALPRQDGHRFCQHIRQQYRALPLMIVSELHDEDEIVRGLREVADDYVTKPFSPHELLARVRALLRRAAQAGEGGQADTQAAAEITVDLGQRRVVVNGTGVHLTPRELSLLNALVSNHNRVLSRDQLIQLAWGDQMPAAAKAVDVYILRLRKKMRPVLPAGFCIRSWRGFGYSFEIPKSAPGSPRLDDRTVTGARRLGVATTASGPL